MSSAGTSYESVSMGATSYDVARRRRSVAEPTRLAPSPMAPAISSVIDVRSLLSGGVATSTLVIAAIFAGIGLAISLPMVAMTHTAANRARGPFVPR